MNLTEASRQWANRPADERYANLNELRDACHHSYEASKESSANPEQIDIRVKDDDLRLVVHGADASRNARFTHWSFGQFCRTMEMPADYLRRLPTELAVRCAQHGIKQWQEQDNRRSLKLLTHRNGDNVLRAMTSSGYERIWNYEVVDRLLELPEGWMVPPARPAFPDQPGTRKATKADLVPGMEDFGLAIKEGDDIAPGALFASDRDMFALMVLPAVRVDDGSDGGLMKAILVSNSEVGAQSLKITKARFRSICGNLILWDVSDVLEVRIVHRGAADERFVKELSVELRRFGEAGVEEEQEAIRAAQRYELGKDKEEVLDTLFGIKNLGPSLKQLEQSYDLAERFADVDGNPRSCYGFAMGMTRLSQQSLYTDQRAKLDRAAGKILNLVS